jgi:4-hydroxy-2-oxoheptanedioate aldolase
MDIPENRFKRAIAVGRQQIGLWCSLPSAFAAEIVAPAGFDWLLFDTEHSPSSVPTYCRSCRRLRPTTCRRLCARRPTTRF